MKRIALILFIVAFPAFAQAPKAPAKTPPVISDKLQKDFFKASSEFQGAQSQVTQATSVAQQKQAAVQAAVKAITDACGVDYHPEVNATGDPVCVETKKPEPAKVEAPKK